jgi:sialate O-acetylesterase
MSHQLWLPSYFASGMVLQQQVACQVRGKTRPDTAVRLELERAPFNNRPISPLDNQYGLVADLTTRSDDVGDFRFELPGFDASFDPFTLRVTDGVNTRSFEEILYGEVWVSSGQANMQMPLAAVTEPEQLPILANLHFIRVLQQSETGLGPQNRRYSITPASDLCGARWLRGDQPDEIAAVSAVAYSFARELHLELHVPIGLIESALGDSHIHAWLDRATIDGHPALQGHVRELGFYRDESDWNLNSDPAWACHQPAALYNSKIAPLQGFGARGILWYQGESDYQYPDYYRQALPELHRQWANVFRPAGSHGLVFLYTQLAPHYYGHRRFSQLAEFNEMLAAVRRNMPGPAGLVTVHDLSPAFDKAPEFWRHPLYPQSKLPVGQRFKIVAMGLAYSRKAPESAPECNDIEIVGNKMLLSFANIGDGLRLVGDETRLRGFAICGPDRVFVEASAKLLYGLRVLVWHEQISEPCAVTYGFADMNQAANLISRDQLPVVPFRSDREPSAYLAPQEWTHCESLQIWSCPSFARPGETGWHPAWLIERGIGELRVEKANKAEGDGSLLFRYQSADAPEFSVEPVLSYDSMFPPLDLSHYDLLSIDVFNPDQQTKYLRLAIACGSPNAPLQMLPGRVTILPALRWQRLQFDLRAVDESGLVTVRRLVFIIEDRKGKGLVYLDQIRLVRPE